MLSGTPSIAEEIINFDIRERSCVAHGHSNWGYYGQLSAGIEGGKQQILLPNDWGQRYAACGRHLAPLHRQSPIELPAPDMLGSSDSGEVEYPGGGVRQVSVEHNCHTVQATLLEAGDNTHGDLRIDGLAYRLLQFHLHTPSEHVLQAGPNGSINYPGEIHFVHAAINEQGEVDASRLAVLGVFIDLSVQPGNTAADKFFQALARDYAGAQTAPDASTPITVDLDGLRSGYGRHWRYQGSLTTPPCTESVEWVVLAEPLVLGLGTYRQLQNAKLDVGIANARPPFLPTGYHALRFTTR
jgi:carbonic anhydrase